jgi:hypothetical protein
MIIKNHKNHKNLRPIEDFVLIEVTYGLPNPIPIAIGTKFKIPKSFPFNTPIYLFSTNKLQGFLENGRLAFN